MNAKYEVVVTAVIFHGDKVLITRRTPNKKRFPGMWTVPGGHLEPHDFLDDPMDTEHYWYNVLEKTLRREVHEEVGIEINNIEYVTTLASTDGVIVISCMADYVSGRIMLQPGETDAATWIKLADVNGSNLIDGIADEIVMAFKKRAGQTREVKLKEVSIRISTRADEEQMLAIADYYDELGKEQE